MTTGASRKAVTVSAAFAMALLAGACSPGDVELNGKLFDAVGASGVLGKQAGSTKMAERQGLVVPPSLDRLPQPGEVQPTAQLAEVKDPDRMKRVSAAELQKQQEAYCKEHYELAKMRGDTSANEASGPAGPCRASAFAAFEKWNKGDSDEPVAEATTGSIAAAPNNSTVTSVTGSTVQVGKVTAAPAR